MKTINCHSCEREFVVHDDDDISTRRVIGITSPTNTCIRKTVTCRCGVINSVKEEDE